MESGVYIVGVGLGAVWGWNGCRDGTGLRTLFVLTQLFFSPDIGPCSPEGNSDAFAPKYRERVT